MTEPLSPSRLDEIEAKLVWPSKAEYQDHVNNYAIAKDLLSIARLTSSQREAGWQPIETAPKDGTRILLFPITVRNLIRFQQEDIAVIGYWYPLPECPDTYPDGGYWVGSRSRHQRSAPTHWMPLPSPPHSIGEG